MIKTMQILLSTPFKVGEIVEPVINGCYDNEKRLFFVVIGYEILGLDETGQVNNYKVICQSQDSAIVYFNPECLIKND